jgi:hypothetical protein
MYYYSIYNNTFYYVKENEEKEEWDLHWKKSYFSCSAEHRAQSAESIQVKNGYNQDLEPQIHYPDESGNITIEIRELERIEIHLSHPSLNAGPPSLNISHIPIGAAFDQKRGIFSWQPGPGYLGDHELMFFKRSKAGEMRPKLITVRIRSQFE